MVDHIDDLPIPPMDMEFPFSDANDDDPMFLFDLDSLLGEDSFPELDNIHLPVNIDEFLFDVADCDTNLTSDVTRVSNSESHPSSSSDNNSCHQSPDGSEENKVSNFPSPEYSGGPASSQGSADGGSDFTSEVKLDEIGKGSDLKRKKENNGGNIEGRVIKHRKSSTTPLEKSTGEADVDVVDECDEKKKARLMRNRESAQLSRQRKKQYVEELEEKVKSMHATIADLNAKLSFYMAENATLKQQLGASGMYAHPPMPNMPYTWMPYAPYVADPRGSQVPLVPIPKLKPQQPVSAPKSNKVSERKKSVGKTKKVASVCLLGFLFFVMLFCGLAPIVNVKFDGLVGDSYGRSPYVSDRLYGQVGGNVLPVNGPMNRSEGYKGVGNFGGRSSVSGSDEFVHVGNGSLPLFASLYVPRNDKMVKIDGNLIISSVVASEKAMASQAGHMVNNGKRETGLAIPKYGDSALSIPEVGMNKGSHSYSYRGPPEQRKALPDGSAEILKDHMKSTSSDGKIQQWFREGLAGPMLSSGMCTEVFQFDISSTQGAIVRASSSAANVSEENHQNATRLSKSSNRRFLRKLPLPGSSSNSSEEHGGQNLLNDSLLGAKSNSSMVVSVLVDPKEAADFDGIMAPKSLSRIFVVVLVDSIKYVTYSCVLPRASPHLVSV